MEEIKDLDDFWEKLPELAAKAGYEAGIEHLSAGFPIYYADPNYPGEIVKHYPNGKREIVRREEGKEVFVRALTEAAE